MNVVLSPRNDSDVESEFEDASVIIRKLMAIHVDVQRVLEILEEEDEEEENDDRS